MNTTKAQLYTIIDQMPEGAAFMAKELLLTAIKAYQTLEFKKRLADAPYDDEPLTAEDIEAIEQARLELAKGEFITQEEFMKELGLC